MDPGVPLIEEIRDGRVHAVHTGHAAHLNADGTVAAAWGQPRTPTYWRSAPKPLQAIPFATILTELGLDAKHLALACASHSGEQVHMEIALETLAAAGLDETSLQCAAHPPMSKFSVRGPDGQGALHNNCSGKHAAMLAVCVHRGWDLASYRDRDHPLQQEILGMLTEATGHQEIETGTDGCGLPTFWLPIDDLARTYQWLDRHPVGKRCLDAMASQPYLVAGRQRFCTALMDAGASRIIGKVGATGVYVVLHRPSGEALSLKMAAGTAKAAESLAASMVVRAGWLPAEALAGFHERPIENCAGQQLGIYAPRL